MLADKEVIVGKDYIVVDVRRTDLDESDAVVLPNAINLPAQSFHQTLPNVLAVLQNVPKVVFHCVSSRGRGTRCAAWYQDILNERGVTTSEAYILTGGVKAWVEAYPQKVIKMA